VQSSGIYAIENVANGNRYYGSTRNFRKRQSLHWSQLRRGRHTNPHLQAAWNLYGESAFKFIVVTECPVTQLLASETVYLGQPDAAYNIARDAVNHSHSEATRAKIGDALRGRSMPAELRTKMLGRSPSPETREKLRIAQTGKRHSLEVRARMAARMTPEARARISAAFTGRVLSDETKDKMRAARLARIAQSHKEV